MVWENRRCRQREAGVPSRMGVGRGCPKVGRRHPGWYKNFGSSILVLSRCTTWIFSFFASRKRRSPPCPPGQEENHTCRRVQLTPQVLPPFFLSVFCFLRRRQTPSSNFFFCEEERIPLPRSLATSSSMYSNTEAQKKEVEACPTAAFDFEARLTRA